MSTTLPGWSGGGASAFEVGDGDGVGAEKGIASCLGTRGPSQPGSRSTNSDQCGNRFWLKTIGAVRAPGGITASTWRLLDLPQAAHNESVKDLPFERNRRFAAHEAPPTPDAR
ncbi:hypothetical protein PV08_03835 [Exophiala spinifera]|uniref:Uncharacterized protein n=1 Tax=Exophiala spinifera TaxID=91928 RepID=A0A0D1ZV90_9EURO|nr:uncharacterized protein PV08_03835 [Exophiala spinifera]KIW16647.1 hypothetical protein PV08_03835 [Exophiala spinifera]